MPFTAALRYTAVNPNRKGTAVSSPALAYDHESALGQCPQYPYLPYLVPLCTLITLGNCELSQSSAARVPVQPVRTSLLLSLKHAGAPIDSIANPYIHQCRRAASLLIRSRARSNAAYSRRPMQARRAAAVGGRAGRSAWSITSM